jgi:hypothetical protein
MAIPIRQLERPPVTQFGETAFFVGEFLSLEEYPVPCRLYVIFVVAVSIIFFPNYARRAIRYANNKWDWSPMAGCSIATDRGLGERMCAGNALMFILEEPVNRKLPSGVVKFGAHSFPASFAKDVYAYNSPGVVFEKQAIKQLDEHINALAGSTRSAQDMLGGNA